MRALRLALAVWLCAACDAPEPTVDPCAESLDAFESELRDIAAHADPEGAPPDVALPTLEGAEALAPSTPLLVVGSGEVRFQGRGVGGLEDPDRAAETLAQDLRVAARVTGQDPLVVGLWAAPEVEVTTLEQLSRVAPPEVRFVLLARAAPAEADPAAPGWVREALAASEPALPHVARIQLEEAWQRALPHCEAALDRLPDRERAAITRADASRLSAAVRECGCDELDLGIVGALARRAMAHPGGALVRHPRHLRFGPAVGPGEEIDVAGTVADLAQALAGRGSGGGVLWVRDPS